MIARCNHAENNITHFAEGKPTSSSLPPLLYLECDQICLSLIVPIPQWIPLFLLLALYSTQASMLCAYAMKFVKQYDFISRKRNTLDIFIGNARWCRIELLSYYFFIKELSKPARPDILIGSIWNAVSYQNWDHFFLKEGTWTLPFIQRESSETVKEER